MITYTCIFTARALYVSTYTDNVEFARLFRWEALRIGHTVYVRQVLQHPQAAGKLTRRRNCARIVLLHLYLIGRTFNQTNGKIWGFGGMDPQMKAGINVTPQKAPTWAN